MSFIKRSFNLDSELSNKIDEIIKENPTLSFTLLVNQAIGQWLKDPKVTVNVKKASTEEIEKIMDNHAELMDRLGHEKQSKKAAGNF